ncbi:RagB/SusD family nutrient uptake outer membrane protein [Arenibacter sp. ARW7G5Y1]|uniref:RagB/SusD family nutrient uptake outer membrane protein n=1 Tax=Arenibacter sp. ARW7G5Y1 TaxID=2135619 RepID=UPI000D7620FB|nr:RagB/SusD family nutrient uptake outer membrane protein [Arenibacter sp. ARW7G5Y1]PXX23777.1 putative outer membrane starch-binding protein [Arenibacter sp. ARW7G5Y1]
MKKIILFIAVLIAIISTSCTDDFLEQAPINQLSSENFIPDLALTGVYDGLQIINVAGSFMWQMGLSPLATNRVQLNFETGVGLDPSNGKFEEIWRDHYRLIFKANLFIDNAVPTENFEQAEINNFIGQAKFIRAYAYSQLAAFYGSVPIHLNSSTTVSEMRQIAKSTKAEVIAQILKDLDEAIAILPDVVEHGRVSKGAAMALKARVLLRENDYPSVLSITEDIINSGIYGLFGETSPGSTSFDTDAYKNLFTLEHDNNEESVFAVQYVGPLLGEGQPFDNDGSYKSARGGNMWFWATKFLVDNYENIDGSPVGTGPYQEMPTPGDPRFLGRDLRFDATITYPGKTIYTGQVWEPGFRIYTRAETRFLITKFTAETDDTSIAGSWFPNGGDSPANIMLIRYADVLLMNAEAKIETGNITDSGANSAIKSINRIRARGGLQPITATTQEELRTALRKERMIEFAGEGLFMFDIRRWGIADVEMERDVEDFAGNVTPHGTRIFSPKLLEWPIPQFEIDNSEGLVQNPLWE